MLFTNIWRCKQKPRSFLLLILGNRVLGQCSIEFNIEYCNGDCFQIHIDLFFFVQNENQSILLYTDKVMGILNFFDLNYTIIRHLADICFDAKFVFILIQILRWQMSY